MTHIHRKLSTKNLTAIEKELSIFNHLKKKTSQEYHRSKIRENGGKNETQEN